MGDVGAVSTNTTQSVSDDYLLKQFFAEVSEVERENEVVRILSCFKLNAFEYLNLPFDSSLEDVKKQYRKLSLLVHPDKCHHPQAKEAFGALAKAQQLLLVPEERDYILKQVHAAKEELRAKRKKQLRKDNASKLKSTVDEGKYEQEFERSEQFQQELKMKVREILTDQEWRRRKMQMRISEEEGRLKKDEEETKELHKRKREHEEQWEGTREQRVHEEHHVSHSLYADDMIMFSNGNLTTVKKFMGFLDKYEAATGQRINRRKSSFLISKKASAATIAQIAQITQMRKAELPMIYLGCPIHVGMAKAEYFQSLIQKLEKKLQGWYAKLLTPGGRIILAKHTLASIPINYMAAIKIPASIKHRMTKILSNFIWNDKLDSKKRNWRKWEDICFPYKENGLGFRSFNDIQNSFSCKLWWKILNGQGLWAQKLMNSQFPIYKLHAWKLLKKTQQTVENQARYVGDPFKHWIWLPSRSGNFSISSAYHTLRQKKLTRYELGEIWKPYIPLKVAFFLWRLYNNLLPYPTQLMKMGINGPFKCPNCTDQDSLLHSFWQCDRARQTWDYFQSILQFQPNTTCWQKFMESWLLNNYKGAFKKMLPVIFYFILWELWKQRCSKLYGEEDHLLKYVIEAVTKNVQYASKIMNLTASSLDDWQLKNLGIVFQKQRQRRVLKITWNFPTDNLVKMNCDGSSLGNPGPGGGGFVMRNNQGKVLLAGWESYENCTNMEAEIEAMKSGIQHCLHHNLLPLMIETDSQVLFQMVQQKSNVPWRYMHHIYTIRQLIQQHQIQIAHIYREGNTVADYLAKQASSTQTTKMLDILTLDPALELLIKRDSMQLPAIRIIH